MEATLEQLSDAYDELRDLYLSEYELSLEVQEAVLASYPVDELEMLAANACVYPSIQLRLAQRHPECHLPLAENKSIGEEAALVLAGSDDEGILEALAGDVPWELVQEILARSSEAVVAQLVLNPHLGADAARVASYHPSHFVRVLLAGQMHKWGPDSFSRCSMRTSMSIEESRRRVLALVAPEDLEAFEDLAPGWEGSAETLLEALRLIER